MFDFSLLPTSSSLTLMLYIKPDIDSMKIFLKITLMLRVGMRGPQDCYEGVQTLESPLNQTGRDYLDLVPKRLWMYLHTRFLILDIVDILGQVIFLCLHVL